MLLKYKKLHNISSGGGEGGNKKLITNRWRRKCRKMKRRGEGNGK